MSFYRSEFGSRVNIISDLFYIKQVTELYHISYMIIKLCLIEFSEIWV